MQSHEGHLYSIVDYDPYNASRLECLAFIKLGIPLKLGTTPAFRDGQLDFMAQPIYVPSKIVANSLIALEDKVGFTPQILVASYVQLGLSEHLGNLLKEATNPCQSLMFAGIDISSIAKNIEILQRCFLMAYSRDGRLQSNGFNPQTREEVEQLVQRVTMTIKRSITEHELATWISKPYKEPLREFPILAGKWEDLIQYPNSHPTNSE